MPHRMHLQTKRRESIKLSVSKITLCEKWTEDPQILSLEQLWGMHQSHVNSVFLYPGFSLHYYTT
jgi:hypothetical protein